MLEVTIRKQLPGFLLDVSFVAKSGSTGLLGASGCGKSMTLKCIAGIEKPDEGRIVLNGRVLFDSKQKINLRPRERKVGYLFQQYALFPTMTVSKNMEIVLGRLPKSERRILVDEMLQKMRLIAEADKKPAQLSGGQQQRAAIGRMLLSAPEIVMLDEPLSALDSFLRVQVEHELMLSLTNFMGPILFVSHNRDEIYRICRDIIILEDGAIAAEGAAEDLFRHPGSLAAAKLTGVKNLAPAERLDEYHLKVRAWGITLCCAEPVPPNTTWVGIRAHHIRSRLPEDTVNCYTFDVERKESQPFSILEYLTHRAGCDAMLHLIPGQMDPVFLSGQEHFTADYHIPPERIMPLSD